VFCFIHSHNDWGMTERWQLQTRFAISYCESIPSTQSTCPIELVMPRLKRAEVIAKIMKEKLQLLFNRESFMFYRDFMISSYLLSILC
jgi:hypothetical protein